MARFGNTLGTNMDVRVRGRTLNVMGMDGMNGTDMLRMTTVLPGALKLSQDLLARVNGQLGAPHISPKILKYARRYFLTPPWHIPGPDLLRMKAVVTAVWNGLRGDVTLKVGQANIGRNGQDVHGWVTWVETNVQTKPYHTPVRSLDDNVERRRGAMHLREGTMESGRLGVVSLIHEATHKYAGTIDYCYITDDGLGPDGGPFDNKDRALMNADSYAWFIVKAGRSWSNRSLAG